jgi:hypothetical protein
VCLARSCTTVHQSAAPSHQKCYRKLLEALLISKPQCFRSLQLFLFGKHPLLGGASRLFHAHQVGSTQTPRLDQGPRECRLACRIRQTHQRHKKLIQVFDQRVRFLWCGQHTLALDKGLPSSVPLFRILIRQASRCIDGQGLASAFCVTTRIAAGGLWVCASRLSSWSNRSRFCAAKAGVRDSCRERPSQATNIE